jgi:hypothetical protein
MRWTRHIFFAFLAAHAQAAVLTPASSEGPYRQPHLAAGNGIVALTFASVRPSSAIHAAVSGDRGRTFSPPVRVAQPGFTSIGRHRGPRVAVAAGSIVVAACVGKTRPAAHLDLVSWRSTDGGRTWSEGVRINQVPESAGEGFHNLLAHGKTFYAVWLDEKSGGVLLSKSADGGATWSKNQLVYNSPEGHVCECCHPSIQIGRDGRLFVMWRNWLKGSRDMYLGTSTDGGTTFRVEKLGQGTWPLNGCPQDGGGLALDARGNPVTAWRREGSVFVARPGQPEQEQGTGTDPAVVVGGDGRIYTVWGTPEVGGSRQARVRGISALKLRVSGHPAVTLDENGRFATLISVGATPLGAWQSGDTIVVKELKTEPQ